MSNLKRNATGGIILNNRNQTVEDMLKKWFEQINFSGCDFEDKALVVNAAMQLYKATGDSFYSEFVTDKADAVLAEDKELNALDKTVLGNYMLGNVMYAAAALTGADKYKAAVKNMAEGLFKLPVNADGVFVDKSGKLCICDAYCTQIFYMQYETKDGGKEHYNNIIDQYRAMYRTVYPSFEDRLSSDNEAAAAVSYFCAALPDTMEVTEQPVYEVYRGMQDIFKSVVADIINHGIFASDREVDVASLMSAYAVLKGCRMKALHTEKYETVALDVLDSAVNEYTQADNAFEKKSAEEVSAFAICYAESLRQRAYQDYGRAKGGVLWS